MNVSRLIDEAIRLESVIGRLYVHFRELFPADADFWWELAIEEKNHAALLEAGRTVSGTLDGFPEKLLPSSIRDLVDSIEAIEGSRKAFETEKPSREEAFNLALDLERSAGEVHFQQFMAGKHDSELAKIFQDLNRGDKDHAVRIVLYMRENGITVRSRQETDDAD